MEGSTAISLFDIALHSWFEHRRQRRYKRSRVWSIGGALHIQPEKGTTESTASEVHELTLVQEISAVIKGLASRNPDCGLDYRVVTAITECLTSNDFTQAEAYINSIQRDYLLSTSINHGTLFWLYWAQGLACLLNDRVDDAAETFHAILPMLTERALRTEYSLIVAGHFADYGSRTGNPGHLHAIQMYRQCLTRAVHLNQTEEIPRIQSELGVTLAVYAARQMSCDRHDLLTEALQLTWGALKLLELKEDVAEPFSGRYNLAVALIKRAHFFSRTERRQLLEDAVWHLRNAHGSTVYLANKMARFAGQVNLGIAYLGKV